MRIGARTEQHACSDLPHAETDANLTPLTQPLLVLHIRNTIGLDPDIEQTPNSSFNTSGLCL